MFGVQESARDLRAVTANLPPALLCASFDWPAKNKAQVDARPAQPGRAVEESLQLNPVRKRR
jgi:hypothetical protein